MIGWNAIALLAATTLAPAPSVPTPEQVMQIPPELRTMLQERVIRPAHSQEQRLTRLVEMVLLPDGLGLQYETAATQTVAETYASRRANCLSFTLLFVALAREAGLDARVQEVRQVVTWYQDQGVIYNSGHVNVGLRIDGREGTVDLDRNVLYDRRGPRVITDKRALAHYYNNRGAELMAEGDLAGARSHYDMALEMSSRFAPTWNNLGVLHARLGEPAAAMRDYETALSIDPRHAPALSNATTLYQRLGETRRAAQLASRLERAQRRDPFYQFRLGVEAERRSDYAAAVRHYRRAVDLHGNAHQFHFGLARAHFLNGDNRRAERELEYAQRLGDNDEIRARYQDKLESLRRWSRRTAQH
ncbi:tetratricopeptide repeat protein [Flavobacterium sp. MXW15]|uniref:Tetratricopeptide repeat protein n=1 Tax=Xanthomonas chitinilytica TaxID=2989819 RepID=A0ABT3JSU9_9XANT|nr:tetratricopeptide repeat protein [Xanthomonas sp. H13-6]MCW4453704.1 tetratricopeptide repeat protein [Flavobacterium sp. MXW15]MCW4471245.1 tetratricopeptide repeat protein [Xanthomonas sp. H13-6]